MALLLNARGLGIALRDNDTAQRGAVFARHLLPGRVALMVAEIDLALVLRRGQEDAPTVVGHLDVAELGPALGIDTDRRAQEDVLRLEAFGPHLLPPVEIGRLPLLKRTLELAVFTQVDVVGYFVVVVDRHLRCAPS